MAGARRLTNDLADDMRRVVIVILATLLSLALVPSPVLAASGDPWSWPLGEDGLGARFDPPADRYGSGHRGIDIAANVGDPVRAVAAGQVTFAGKVAGVLVVTISHGRERSTYQPVAARVRVGDAVDARQVIGTLVGAPSHCANACLHLGRRVGQDYLDPLELMSKGRFVLISPDGPAPAPPAGFDGTLQRPVGGPITSPFGMRVHPVTGVRKLHDGTDFGVACGTPVHAAGGGIVTALGSGGPYGMRLTIRHAPGLESSYNHLSAHKVSAGDTVSAGEVIALSGNTGLSTGCHLHFMVLRDGRPSAP